MNYNSCIDIEIHVMLLYVCTGNMRAILEHVLKVQQEIQITLAIHTNMLNALMQSRSNGSKKPTQLPAGLLHVKDMEGFKRLNTLLESDDVATALVSRP
jgi:hypothetical protein